MPAGFEVYGPNGEVWLSVTDRLTRLLTSIEIPQWNMQSQIQTLSYTHPDINVNRTWWYFFHVNNGMSNLTPIVTITGTTITARRPDYQQVSPCTMFIGVY